MNIAAQFDISVITFSLDEYLATFALTVSSVSLKETCLMIMIEGNEIDEQEKVINLIKGRINQFDLGSLKKIKVYGKKHEETFPQWEEEFPLESLAIQPITPKSSWWNSLTQTVTWTNEAVGGAVVQAGGMVTDTAKNIGGAIAGATVSTGSAIAQAALSAPDGVGYLCDLVNNNPQLKQITQAFQLDWLIQIIDTVDVVKAETEVKKLQQKYPHEKPPEIAHYIIINKAMYAGGTGLASSLLPGVAAATFAVDLVATTLLQAEMVYQIACAYGLDLQDSARKGEVLAIFGLALGGSQAANLGGQYAVKAGLGFFRNIPAAGAVIGASTNALIIYALGRGACRFYAAKVNSLTMEATLEQAQLEGANYLQTAIAQEVIMDQILVHLILAGNSSQTRETILPELQTLNLSPASLETISQNLDNPPSLDDLLLQLNQDFAIALMAQCEQVAKLDGVIMLEELAMLKKIANYFNLPVTL